MNNLKAFENSETILTASLRKIQLIDYLTIGDLTEGGSYNIICARLLGLSYPNYLRFCRDNFGAKIMGKGLYAYPVFPDSKACDCLVNEMNKRWKKLKGLKNE